MNKKTAFIVVQKSHQNMGMPGVSNAINAMSVASNF